jgi:hypothetical protein
MAEETEREEIKEETHELGDEEQGEMDDETFEPGIKEPQKEVSIVENQQLNALPENEEEEKEEILLTTAETKKPKKSAAKANSSTVKRQPNEISSADMGKHLERQTTQLNKIIIMLQSIQKDSKSTNGQSIKELQSQLKQLQNQLTQIQKIITKKSLAIRTIPSRKKMLNPKRSKKKR